MNKLGIIDRKRTVFALVDIQKKTLNAIAEPQIVVSNSNKLVESSKILGIPLIISEQYPKGLGATSGLIALPGGARPIEKVSFSCFGCSDFKESLKHLGKDTIVLFGVEAHICILKTALDALAEGYEVHVVADAVSSRNLHDKALALERMRQSGVFIASTEMVLFQLMDVAGTEEFKAISRLVK